MAHGLGWSMGQVVGLGILEFMSALSILGNVGARFGAAILMMVMVEAMYYKIVKWHVPFMAQSATGWEFDFLLFCASLTIYLKY